MTARGLARRFGMSVEIADLGLWWPAVLCSEYDAKERVARVNARLLRCLPVVAHDRFMNLAIAHELYHHLRTRRNKPERCTEERAATSFAERLTATKVASVLGLLPHSLGAGVNCP